ncbi:MAG: SDR family NAD(P)-dependent oxidoreductase, partial [Hyphomicrobiales bacterium]|nr:SDR family NAD(P)-dependent oxidoreductase [Hyphomicrobiales bacterium]
MFDDLAGKSALVTGASRGLGLHFAELLAGHGVNVTLAARDKAALATAQARVSSDGGVAAIVDLDVTDKASVEAAIAFVPGTLDILVNNAGITAGGSALTIEEHDWDQVIDTNLKGSFLVAQAAAKRVSDEKTGSAIVNIASILGLRVAGGLAAYAASKAAVVQLTGALALEWARYG